MSDSDSVDTDGYFTSFRSDCGFPRVKKSASIKELEENDLATKDNIGEEVASLSSSGGIFDTTLTSECSEGGATPTPLKNELPSGVTSSEQSSANTTVVANTTQENEYELFGKGSTSTTASSCGTVVMRSKPEPPARTTSTVINGDALDKDNAQNCGSANVSVIEEFA